MLRGLSLYVHEPVGGVVLTRATLGVLQHFFLADLCDECVRELAPATAATRIAHERVVVALVGVAVMHAHAL